MTSSRRQLRRDETEVNVEDLPCAMDTIDTIRMRPCHLGRTQGVGLVDDGVVASLSGDISKPLCPPPRRPSPGSFGIWDRATTQHAPACR